MNIICIAILSVLRRFTMWGVVNTSSSPSSLISKSSVVSHDDGERTRLGCRGGGGSVEESTIDDEDNEEEGGSEPVPQQHSTRKALGLGPRLGPSWQYLYSQPRHRRRPRPRRRRPLRHRSYNAAEPLFQLLQSLIYGLYIIIIFNIPTWLLVSSTWNRNTGKVRSHK